MTFLLLTDHNTRQTFIFHPLTLNVCCVSAVKCSKSLLNEIEQSAMELLRFKYVQFVRCMPY